MFKRFSIPLIVLAFTVALRAAEQPARESAPPAKPAAVPSIPTISTSTQEPSRLYVLKPNDAIEISVYREQDLTTRARIARDGTITFPLLGTVVIGSNTVEQAVNLIRTNLAKDYLVNPQVTLTIIEYAKRRFTVVGNVVRPGTYEMPTEDKLTLVQAIAMAGDCTRIGNPHKVTVERVVNGTNQLWKVDAGKMATDKKTPPFEIFPDDVIRVGEKLM